MRKDYTKYKIIKGLEEAQALYITFYLLVEVSDE